MKIKFICDVLKEMRYQQNQLNKSIYELSKIKETEDLVFDFEQISDHFESYIEIAQEMANRMELGLKRRKIFIADHNLETLYQQFKCPTIKKQAGKKFLKPKSF